MHPFYDAPGKTQYWAASFCEVVPALPSKEQLSAEQQAASDSLTNRLYRLDPKRAAELDSIGDILRDAQFTDMIKDGRLAEKLKTVMQATEARQPIPASVWED